MAVRSALDTPNALTLPAFACGIVVEMSANTIEICPPSRSVMACGLLLYGTFSRSTPASDFSISPAIREELEPLPKVISPGLAFAYSISSCAVATGTEGLTTKASVIVPSLLTGAKSATGS